MASALLFNTCHLQPSHKYTYLLNLIALHPSFKSTVNQYYQILNNQPTLESIIQLGTNYFALFLPDYPLKQLKLLAQQLFESIRTHDNKATYNNLKEYLLKLCSFSLQNIDVAKAIGFLQLLKSRITDTFIVNSLDPKQKRKVNVDLKLEILDSEVVIAETALAQKHLRQEMKHVYFEEKVSLVQKELAEVKEDQVVVTRLKTHIEDILPWGYISEDYLDQYTNGNFTLKSSYRLRKNKKLTFSKLDYWVTVNESSNNLIRDLTVNQEVFIVTGVLTIAHLPAEINPPMSKPLSMARINRTFARNNYLQKLKELTSGQFRFYNILSEYFDRDEFNIDELTLTRERLIVQRKENLLGITGKESVSKEVKDYELQTAILGETISKNLVKFHDQQRTQAIIKELQTTLRLILQEDKNLNLIIEKHLSYEDHILKDTDNAFMDDVLQYTKLVPLQLLIIGRPKSGKTTLAKSIAKKYNLIYISVQSAIDKVIERNKFYEQNPPQADEDGNVKDGLLPIEKYILSELSKGKAVEEEDVLDLINNQFEKEITHSRGFILDLPFEYNKYWIETLISNRIYLPKIQSRYFTHILQTDQTQEQWKHFTSALLEKPENLTLSSALDRYIQHKPKPVPQQGQEEPQAEQGQKQPPLVQSNLLQVKVKDSSFSLIEHLTQHIHPHRFIKVQNSFQSVDQCLSLLEHSLYKIPLPKKIEGNQKELLSVGLEQAKVFRQWSPWGLIDCVELSKDKLIPGKFQFAAEYAGRVFVFENEANLNAFLNLPRNYLKKLPELPKTTNIFITGPRQSGKKTIAAQLGNIYGLKVVNVQEILESVLLRQKQFETHVPSNFDKRSASIHLSEAEFKQFSKGGLLNAKDVLPIILYHIGVGLQKKPAGWGIQKSEEEGGAGQNVDTQDRKPAPKKAKKKDKNAQEERPKTPPPEDLPLKDLIPQINHFGKLNQIRGYVFVGYPNNEEQLNSLKQFNVPIDKLIILSDNTQEAPNRNLQKRLSDAEIQQVALFTAAIGPVKEALGEDICKQVFIDKTPAEIVNKIRQLIDPFYLKTDEDSINRVCADKQEDADPIPLGFCGEFCPVSLKNGWLIKGKDQFETGVQGRRFKFSGQKQLADFKADPSKYLTKESPAIAPRIMFMGVRGVGLKTQLLKLNEKYRIPILTFKQTLLQQLENRKNQRKTERYYNKGFKKPEFDEEGKQLEDPQLLEQSADFDRRANEIDTVKALFSGINEIFINGNFFEVDEEKVSTGLAQLLGEGRRLPELLLVLTCDEQKWLQRVLDRKAIERELEDIKEKRRIEKQLERQQARKKALEAGQEYNQPPEEEDAELPKLQQMIAQKQESLKAQRQADTSKLEQFAEAFKAWGVEVVTIKCERETKHVTDRINYAIKPYLEDRINRWQKNSMLAIDRHRVRDFLNNYIVQQSRFGKLNPFTLFENAKPFPLIYKDRIYYLKDEEERDYVMRNPKSLHQNQAIPRDVKFTPILFIIGKPKSGKSTLARNIRDKYGFKLITVEEILEEFSKEHEDHDIRSILYEVRSGKQLSDESIVTLIEKRTVLHDCHQGWILDGLPLNKKQCELFNKKGIVPTLLLITKLTQLQIKKRILSKAKQNKSLYDDQIQVVDSRLQTTRNNLVEVQVYYESRYNNVTTIDGNMSKWGMLEQSRTEIQKKVKAKRNFIRDLVTHSATDVTHIGLSFNCILHNLSQYLNFCPISYKIRREYTKVALQNYDNIALFNRKIYAFKTNKQLNDFLNNPDTFVNRGEAFSPPQEINIEDLHSVYSKFQNQGYSMTDLAKKQLVRGNSLFGLAYKQKYFLLSSAKNLKAFQKNPALYELLKLPDKLPVQFEKKSDLKKIAKRNDCSAFLQHHLSNIMMRCLAQLGYRRPKYPSLGSKESALKFLAINLKAANPNKDDEYRQKYSQKLNKFIKECTYSQEIREELERKATGQWQQHDEQNLLKLCEEYSQFMKHLESTDKNTFFSDYIR